MVHGAVLADGVLHLAGLGLCIAVGVAVGQLIPAVPNVLGEMEVAKVNLPIAVLIWAMIYPMMVQVDFGAIFSKLTTMGFDGWAVVEWECALKHPEDGAREGAQFVRDHIIRVTESAFDDFAAGGADDAANRKMLGLEG